MTETSIVSGDIPSCISADNLLIRRYPADLGSSIYSYDGSILDEVDLDNIPRTIAIGIGPFGAKVAKSLSTNSYCVESYEIASAPTGGDIVEVADLVATVQKCHLLFIISGFEDSNCDLLFNQLAETGKKTGVLTVGVIPEGDNWTSSSPEHFAEHSKCVDTLIIISDRSLNEQQYQVTINAEQREDLRGELIRDVIAGISHILTQAVMVTVFFDEIETAFKSGLVTRVGVGEASGVEQGSTATQLAVKELLDQQVCIESVTGAIAYMQVSSSVTMDEYEGMSRVIHEHFPEGINIAKSLLVNESMGNNVIVIIVAVQAERIPG